MRVVVVGAGIGGLVLAHGLRRDGFDVLVLERDVDLARTGGFSLRLRQPAVLAMRSLLPDPVLERILAHAPERTGSGASFEVLDHRRRRLGTDDTATPRDVLDVDRISLRLALADGLDDVVRRGATVVGSRLLPGGSAAAVLDTGEVVAGDVVIAADGVNSPITTGLAGGPTAAPTALIGVAGRTAADGLAEPAGRVFRDRSTLAVGPGGSGLYVGHHRTPGAGAPRDVLVWGAILLQWARTDLLRGQRAGDLVRNTTSLLAERQWHEDLLALVAAADPESVSAFQLHASPTYPAALARWAPGPVTGLGDAVHAMPPTGGQGASTAIRDAAVLHEELVGVRAGHRSLEAGIESYHRRMRPYAAAAVAESMQPAQWIRASARPLGASVSRAGRPAAAAVSWAVRAARPAPAA